MLGEMALGAGPRFQVILMVFTRALCRTFKFFKLGKPCPTGAFFVHRGTVVLKEKVQCFVVLLCFFLWVLMVRCPWTLHGQTCGQTFGHLNIMPICGYTLNRHHVVWILQNVCSSFTRSKKLKAAAACQCLCMQSEVCGVVWFKTWCEGTGLWV